MSNYTKTTDFEAKDSLPSGDSGKIIRGSEFETEFDNIATAIATKADAANPTFTGTVTIDGLTVNGNTTLGNAATDTVTVTADIASNLIPSADDTYNLGASGAEWNDLFIDGTANIDSLVADTADINGGTIDGVTIGGSSAGAITGTAISGTSFASTGNMTFGDNNKAIFGAGSDLQIYHDGTDSLVRNTTGNLYIQDDNGNIFLRPKSGQSGLTLAADGATTLFHAGSSKLATTSTGVDVTGTIVSYGVKSVDNLELSADHDNNSSAAYSNILFKTDGSERVRINSSGNVGIGTTSPSHTLTVNSGTVNVAAKFISTDANAWLQLEDSNTTTPPEFGATGDELTFRTNGSEAIRIDDSGNVGIGTDSPAFTLDVNSGTTDYAMRIQSTDSTAYIAYQDNSTSTSTTVFNGAIGDAWAANGGNAIRLLIGLNEKARIDSSGNLLVGKTSAGSSNVGVEARPAGYLFATGDGINPLRLNRLTSDGTIAEFQKGGTTVGVIGTGNTSRFHVGSGTVGLMFSRFDDVIFPWDSTNNVQKDAAIDLGVSFHRFKDLYLSGGAYLGGTAAANKLDDYEEGTWTPVYTPSTGGFTTLTMDIVNATYTKVGNIVTINVFLRTDDVDIGTASGTLKISGIPFTASGYNSLSVGYASAFASNTPSHGWVQGSFITLQYRANADTSSVNATTSSLTTGTIANRNVLAFTATYATNS